MRQLNTTNRKKIVDIVRTKVAAVLEELVPGRSDKLRITALLARTYERLTWQNGLGKLTRMVTRRLETTSSSSSSSSSSSFPSLESLCLWLSAPLVELYTRCYPATHRQFEMQRMWCKSFCSVR